MPISASSVPVSVQVVAPVAPVADPHHSGGVYPGADEAGPAEDHADEAHTDEDHADEAHADAGEHDADAVGSAVPAAAQRRSGRANQGVPGLRIGFEHEAFLFISYDSEVMVKPS
jgi:hypothetical protein